LTKTLRQGGTFTGDSTPVVNILKEIKGAFTNDGTEAEIQRQSDKI